MPGTVSPARSRPLSRSELEETTEATFLRTYDHPPRYVASAPGRVNLIGEHTDYNMGFVLPLAINRFMAIAVGPREDRQLQIYAGNLNASLKAPLDDLSPRRTSSWANYVKGVAALLQQRGQTLRGTNMCVQGDVPRGAGLSSSAAFEMATAFAFRSLHGLEIGEIDLIRLCQQAEHEFVGVKCGIMDQFISCLGRNGKALLLDCLTLEYEYVPLPPTVSVVVLDTGVRRALASSEYNRRREECTAAVSRLAERLPSIRSLREVTREQFAAHEDSLDPLPRKRARHVIAENERVLRAAAAMRAGRMDELGKLLYDSHISLQRDYEVSCPELDAMVDICAECECVIGARMTGAGFGGCAICLAYDEAVDEISSRVLREYPARTGKTPTIHVCTAEDGASARAV